MRLLQRPTEAQKGSTSETSDESGASSSRRFESPTRTDATEVRRTAGALPQLSVVVTLSSSSSCPVVIRRRRRRQRRRRRRASTAEGHRQGGLFSRDTHTHTHTCTLIRAHRGESSHLESGRATPSRRTIRRPRCRWASSSLCRSRPSRPLAGSHTSKQRRAPPSSRTRRRS